MRGERSSFSLIELVIALAILAVGLVGAMRVFPVGLRASQRAEMSSRAALLAQRTLESLKLKSWDDLKVGDAEAEEGALTVDTQITEFHAEHLTDPPRIKVLEVTVRWTQDGRLRQQTYVTYVRREPS